MLCKVGKSGFSIPTCAVKGEEEEEQPSEQVSQKSDHSTSDAFRDRVYCLNEELEEYWHTAVYKDASKDAWSVEDGCEKTTANKLKKT